MSCPRCGAASTAPAKFCAECGMALQIVAGVESRKTVTALFCDVSGSTALGERLDPEALRLVMERYFSLVSAVLERHGGSVEKFVGDAVMAVFGVPLVHEDDAVRACRAALEILEAVAQVDGEMSAVHGVGFSVRVGLETGEVLVGDTGRRSTFASGAAVNMAARLEQAAGPAECLIGSDCYRLVRDVVDVEPRPGLVLKGIEETVQAYLLRGLRDPARRWLPDGSDLVGRARELSLLRQAMARATEDRTCQLVTVLGPAGMGKSRLAAAFLREVEPSATVLRSRCVSYGDGVTYLALVEAVRQAAGLTGAEPEADARRALAGLLSRAGDAADVIEHIAPIAGLGGAPSPPEDTAWAVRRLLEELSRDRPVVLLVDDLHWAEPGLVAVLDNVSQWSHDAPVLLLVLARPEFVDDHPTWGAGRVNAVTALLEPLRDDDVDSIISSVLDGALDDGVATRVRAVAGGNPLFVEQLLAMLMEQGALRRAGSSWLVAEADTELQVPPTINALITARLDRLTTEERAVLGPASVIGQLFYRDAVVELASVDGVGAHLSTLVRKGLVRPAVSDVPGHEALRFGHVLVRDAVYASLTKAARADLHERFARWIAGMGASRVYDDFVGGHLEAAYLNLVDLGALDIHGVHLGREAADRLEAAAGLLLFTDDAAASALLERADRLRDDESPSRWALRIELVKAWHRQVVRLKDAITLADRVRAAAESAGDIRWSMHARLEIASLRQNTQPQGATEELRRVAQEALKTFGDLGDNFGLACAHLALSNVAGMASQLSESAREMALVADHAELAGRPREAKFWRHWLVVTGLLGESPVEQAMAESQRQLEQADTRQYKALAAASVSALARLLGQSQEAEAAWSLAKSVAADLQAPVMVSVSGARGQALLAVGRWQEATTVLAEAAAAYEASGAESSAALAAAQQAVALLHIGDVATARERAAVAGARAAVDDVATRSYVLAVRAWLAAIDGDSRAAVEHMAQATAALPAEVLLDRALVHVVCAEASGVLGDAAGARRHRQAAVELYRRKGSHAGVAYHEARL